MQQVSRKAYLVGFIIYLYVAVHLTVNLQISALQWLFKRIIVIYIIMDKLQKFWYILRDLNIWRLFQILSNFTGYLLPIWTPSACRRQLLRHYPRNRHKQYPMSHCPWRPQHVLWISKSLVHLAIWQTTLKHNEMFRWKYFWSVFTEENAITLASQAKGSCPLCQIHAWFAKVAVINFQT